MTVVLTRSQRAPIDDLLASAALEAARAEALVSQITVAASGAILARIGIASIDAGLAV